MLPGDVRTAASALSRRCSRLSTWACSRDRASAAPSSPAQARRPGGMSRPATAKSDGLQLCAERVLSVLRTRETDARADGLLQTGQTSLNIVLKRGQIRGQLISRLHGWQPVIASTVVDVVFALCANNFSVTT